MQTLQENTTTSRLTFPVRWAAWPLLLLALLYGLPISGRFFPHQQFIDQVLSKGRDEEILAYIILDAGLYVLAFIALWKVRSLALFIIKRQWPLVALTLLVGCSAFWSNSPVKACIIFGHNVGVIMVALAASLLYRNEPVILIRLLGYALGLNILLNLIAVLALPQVSIDFKGRWRGLTSNPNVLGVLSLCSVWAIGMACVWKEYGKRLILIGLLIFAVIALFGTHSGTARLCAVLGLSVGCVMTCCSFNHPSNVLYIISFSIFGFLAVLLLCFWGNAWDSLSPVGLNRLIGKSDNYSGRTTLWTFALELIPQKLWLGQGFDGTAGESSKFKQLNLHNGYLELAVRGGLTATLLFVISLWKIIRNISNFPTVQKHAAVIFLPFVLAFLAYNLTESTIMNPRNLSWVIFILIAFMSESQYLRAQ